MRSRGGGYDDYEPIGAEAEDEQSGSESERDSEEAVGRRIEDNEQTFQRLHKNSKAARILGGVQANAKSSKILGLPTPREDMKVPVRKGELSEDDDRSD